MTFIDDLRAKKLGRTGTSKQQTKSTKSDLGRFYDTMASISPANCENCGRPLAWTISFHPRAHVCHIVPKSKVNGCPSVATNPDNVFFGCKDCHDIYDNCMNNHEYEEVRQMKIFPVLKERVAKFYHLIPSTEQRRVPQILTP